VNAVNRIFEDPAMSSYWNPTTAAGRAALDAVVTRQAEIIAYIDDYKLLMIATLAIFPFVFVFNRIASPTNAPECAGCCLTKMLP
jgi:DHA2 family multidrug resistance protein